MVGGWLFPIRSDSCEFPANSVTKGRYTYVHEVSKGSPEAIDVHHIIVRTNGASYLLFCTYALLLSIMSCPILLLFQDKTVGVVLWSFTLAGFLLMHLRKQVEKESVIIFPSLGVQLETLYRSGKIDRQFVPVGKILKPVLNECLTPVTCYWSLSLILHEKEELLLLFKRLYPPVKMLVPIWEALSVATVDEECSKLYSDCVGNMSEYGLQDPCSR